MKSKKKAFTDYPDWVQAAAREISQYSVVGTRSDHAEVIWRHHSARSLATKALSSGGENG